MVQIYTKSYYRKESAAFMAHELHECKIYTSRQFSVISPMFPSRSSFKPVHKLILKLCARNTSK